MWYVFGRSHPVRKGYFYWIANGPCTIFYNINPTTLLAPLFSDIYIDTVTDSDGL